MGKQPAVVIIARHGARLDQANKQWQYTSPTPYDPPLTYAGWTQARNLGTRIGGIIKNREKETGEEEQNGNPRKRKRQHRVIIHSSPFLRCIQTSIGISAGIGQSQTKTTERSLRTSLPVHPEQPESCQPAKELTDKAKRRFGLVPTKLRLDAYLGEWLSPGYFDGITPPPDSVLLVARAKSDLLRAGDEIRGSDLSGRSNGQWANTWSAVDESGRGSSRSRFFDLASQGLATVREDQPAYVPPSPMYAISSSDPIPGGYVAHARDACVEVDYQWDSIRPPQNWGDGGEYGEEWSSMHRRFRNGVQHMLGWYEKNTEDDIDTVIVIVTHGAGCNALIGAMTGQPVLLDIGLASLTLATRKQGENVPSLPASPIRTRRGSLDLGIATRYDMEIIASTEHLRAPSNPLGLNSPRLARSPAFASKRVVGPDSVEGFTLGESMRSNSYMGRSAGQSGSGPKASSGLWSSSGTSDAESTDSDLWPAFDRGKTVVPAVEKTDEVNKLPAYLPARTSTQAGLWGSAPALSQDHGRKRRWTVADQ